MVVKKALACVVVFALLLVWGWRTDSNIQATHHTTDQTVPSSDGFRISQNGFAGWTEHNVRLTPFRPREYVRIVRLPQSTDPGPPDVIDWDETWLP